MAKSIRVSDEFYAFSERTGATLGRSLAQQFEHWARLGAALDAAGITTAQALHLLSGDSDMRQQVLAALGLQATEQRGAKVIAKHHAKDERDVAAGDRQATDMFAFPGHAIRGARLVPPPVTRKKTGGW